MNYLGDSNLWAFVLLLIIWNLFFFLGIWARIKDKTVKIMVNLQIILIFTTIYLYFLFKIYNWNYLQRMPIDLADNSARNKYIYLVIVKTGRIACFLRLIFQIRIENLFYFILLIKKIIFYNPLFGPYSSMVEH